MKDKIISALEWLVSNLTIVPIMLACMLLFMLGVAIFLCLFAGLICIALALISPSLLVLWVLDSLRNVPKGDVLARITPKTGKETDQNEDKDEDNYLINIKF